MSDPIALMHQLPSDINELSRELPAIAAENSRDNTVPRLSFQVKRKVQLMEEIANKALDWGDLESWLDHVRGAVNEHQRNFQTLSEFLCAPFSVRTI